MGFLKYTYIALLALTVTGCAPSSIKLNTRIDKGAYSMFGMVPARNFYIPVELADTLIERWEGEVNGNFTNSSVAVSDSFIFVNDLSGRITCFRINDGKKVGQLKNKGTVVSTPVIHKFFVIYADAYNKDNKSDLIYYDISTGKVAFQTELKGRVLSQLIKTSDGIILLTENGIVGKYDFRGSRIWETKTNYYTHSSPALADSIIVFGNDAGDFIGLDEKTGNILYRENLSSSFFGSASISEGLAYIGSDNGEMLVIDITNGKVKWRFESGSRIIANPVMNESNIIVCNLNGDVFNLNKNNGVIKWKQSTGGVINAAPLLTKNRIIVPDLSGKVFFIDYFTGAIKKTLTYPARIRLSPVIFERQLFIGFDKGILKSYEVFF